MEDHKKIQSTPGTSLSVAVFPWRQIVKIYAAATKQTEWLERSLSTAGVVASSTENKLLWDKAKTPNSNDFQKKTSSNWLKNRGSALRPRWLQGPYVECHGPTGRWRGWRVAPANLPSETSQLSFGDAGGLILNLSITYLILGPPNGWSQVL